MKFGSRNTFLGEIPPLFDGLDNSSCRKILDQGISCTYAPEETILRQGFPATHIVVVEKGIALVSGITSVGDTFILRWLRSGDSLGCVSLLEGPQVYPFAVEAFTEIEAIRWSRPVFWGMMTTYPRLMENVLQSNHTFLRIAIERIELLTSATVQRRVAMILMQSAEQIGNRMQQGTELNLFDEQLAQMAGTTLFSVSRLLQSWERSGLLKKTRGRIFLLNELTVEQLVEAAKKIHLPHAVIDPLRQTVP